jgi:hypothetical protein
VLKGNQLSIQLVPIAAVVAEREQMLAERAEHGSKKKKKRRRNQGPVVEEEDGDDDDDDDEVDHDHDEDVQVEDMSGDEGDKREPTGQQAEGKGTE